MTMAARVAMNSTTDIERIRGDTIRRVLRQLELARVLIRKHLASMDTSASTRIRLQSLQGEVERQMQAFQTAATTITDAGASAAMQAGLWDVAKPLADAGMDLTPRINPRVLTHLRTALTGLITDISLKTKARINAQIAQVLIGTQPITDAIAAVDTLLGGSARRRAQTILYTELGRINSAAAQSAMEDAVQRLPGLKKRWVGSGKKHPRHEHVAAHGQVRAVHESFDVGGEKLLYPRDPRGSARNTINCGCRHIPVVDGSTWGKSTLGVDMAAENAEITLQPPSPTVVSDENGILASMKRTPTPVAIRSAWPADFPPVPLHATEKAVKQHPSYVAAKAGDSAAALRLIHDLIDLEIAFEMAERFSADRPILVPVYAVEATGKNFIPPAFASSLAMLTRWEVDDLILQSNKVGRTGQDGYYRLAVQPTFHGKVQAGRAYLMVDDFLGQGATFANLRGYITQQGGRVVGATALTGKTESSILALSPATLAQLREVHGEDLENWWREQFGFGFESLTESEARYLIKRTDAQRVRAEVLARRGQGG